MSVSAVLNLFKPAPHVPEITDPLQVKREYRYWRLRIFYSMYVGYIFYYFTRKSFTFITPFLISDIGLTKSEVGILASILSLAYGISKFTSGVLCDLSNPRYFMAIGLIMTGISNLLFGVSSSIYLFALFWGLNGWFQGWGWPACTKQITHWFGRTERGTWWSAATTSHTVGGFLIAYIAAYVATWFGWRYAMFLPGVMCIIGGCWLINRLRDVPESLGLPSIEKFQGEEPKEMNAGAQAETKTLPVKQILFEQILNNKYVWILSLSYFFVYIVRQAVNDWGNLFLAEAKGLTPIQAAACVSWFEIGGFFGILLAGYGSDKWFQGRRVPISALSGLGLVFAVGGLWYINPGELFIPSLLIALIGFLVFGPQMLVGLAAAEAVDKKAASASNGFAGVFASLGMAAGGYPILRISEVYGWWGFIAVLVVCSAIISVMLIPIWQVGGSTKKVEDSEESQDSRAVLQPATR